MNRTQFTKEFINTLKEHEQSLSDGYRHYTPDVDEELTNIATTLYKKLYPQNTIKIALARIPNMCGEYCLFMGICRTFPEGDEHWTIKQLYTFENYLPGGRYHDRPEWLQEDIDKRAPFRGSNVTFNSINKTLTVKSFNHSFNFKENQVEITLEELKKLEEEMHQQGWEPFDDETWGK